MPPEPLPFDRKDFLKDRKPLSVDPVGIVPQRWREPATTPSHHNNHGSPSSCRWGGGGGLSDFRRPFSGLHGKRIGGGWDHTTVESGSKENSCITNSDISMAFGSQKDSKGANSWETTASPNGNSLPHNDFVKSSDQLLQSVDQHPKNSGGGFSSTTNNNQRLEKESSLGSSLDWKPLKWIRSSSRGVLVDPLNNKTVLQSSSEDAATCVTPRTPDDVSSCKKQRLGWGEGLAKYEKKKVDPDDRNGGMVDGVSGSEPLLTSPSNLSDKSPSVNGYLECASPATPYSFACSSSPGVEEKETSKIFAVDNDTCNPSVVSCHLSENHTQGLSFSLSSSLEELMQSDDSSSPGRPGFVKSTAKDKLQVWKRELTRTLETTETEIDSLENELKSLVSDGGPCPLPPAASISSLTECNNKTNEESSEPFPVEKTDSSPEEVNGVEDSGDKSPGTTSEPVAKSSEDVGDEVPTTAGSSSSTVSDGEDVDNGKEDKLYGMLFASNKAISNTSSGELGRMLLPTTQPCTNISKAHDDELLIKKRIATRNRFLKLKERVITSKFRALHHSWKEDLHLLSTKKSSGKSHRKFEWSSRMGYADNQKSRSPGGGGLSLVPTAETLDYVKKLLTDSRVRVHRSEALKMPCLKLDRRERLMTRFNSDNGLVEDPVDIEKERSIVNSWTEKEKEIFLDKYALFGKDFKKIASFLEFRTVGDCVEYYYKNHKSECFQNAKKKSAFAKGKASSTAASNTYLVTPSGRRLNGEVAAASSLEMLGTAASAMVANVDDNGQQQKKSRRIYDGKIVGFNKERSNGFGMFCNEQETAAADVLAGICGSISTSEALSSCITSLVDSADVYHHQKLVGGYSSRRHLSTRYDASSLQNDADEETCSDDDSYGGEMMMMNPSADWTDGEKSSFLEAVRSYGKDFSMISRSLRTRSRDECKAFYSKARKCLGLDAIHVEGPNHHHHDHDHKHDDAHDDTLCMVDSGSVSVISCDKSSSELKMEVEEVLHSSDSKQQEPVTAECDQIVANEGRVVSEEEDAPQIEQSGVKVEEVVVDTAKCLDLSINHPVNEKNGLLPASASSSCHLFIQDPPPSTIHHRKTHSQDDVSSRLSFRRSSGSQRSSSTDGYHHLHLPKHSLMDCVESSSQVVSGGGYPVTTTVSPLICSQQQRQGGGLGSDVGRKAGDVKLFGQILTNSNSSKINNYSLQENGGGEKTTNGRKSFNLKFDNHSSSSGDISLGGLSDVPLRTSYGFWDGTRIQTGFPSSLPPDSSSSILVAQYPSGFAKSSVKNNVGVSDPVAAIRMHYAQTQHYNNKNGSNGATL